jgi:hypothetical protein
MFHSNALTFARRSALPLALLSALGSPVATAATAGLCKLMANTTIHNISGYPLSFLKNKSLMLNFVRFLPGKTI